MRRLAPIFLLVLLTVSANSQSASNEGRVYWFGSVDDKVQLTITGITLEQKAISGRPMPDGNHSFTAPLPQAPVAVTATKLEGRGTVSVIQQPTAENSFTAIIEISDTRGGAAEHLIDVSWR